MSDWQPIETAPKDGTSIIGWNGHSVSEIAWIRDSSDCDHGRWCCSGFSNGWVRYDLYHAMLIDPTDWMPLPEPPK